MGKGEFNGKTFGTVFNDDTSCAVSAIAGLEATAEGYKDIIRTLLGFGGIGMFAAEAGDPDCVLFRSEVATYMSKYYVEAARVLEPDFGPDELRINIRDFLDRLASENTDPVQLSVEACREAGVPVVASFRMNAEDYYQAQLQLSDFGRTHPHLSIPGRNCLDPIHPEVYMHRLDIFREVLEKYDLDGIELNFRRTYWTISNPLENFGVLTRMVKDVRRILDDVAVKKGRGRMIFGARVGAYLDGAFDREYHDGGLCMDEPIPGYDAMPWWPYNFFCNPSCRDLGLDIKAWIDSGAMDYISPMLFNARLPGLCKTGEFADLAVGSDVGIYPTLFAVPQWLSEHTPNYKPNTSMEKPIEEHETDRMLRFKKELCEAGLQMYKDGADGIGIFNWWPQHLPGVVRNPDQQQAYLGMGGKKVLAKVLAELGDRAGLEAYYGCDDKV